MELIETHRRRKVEINIVPLVDVLIVLIFFFLVSMQFRNMTTLNLVLPKIETAGKNKNVEQLEIAIDAAGQFFLSGVPISKDELEFSLNLQGELNREIPVLVMADEETYLKRVTYIMDVCREAGLEKIRLQSR
ncbi:MAG: Biopolymer transport protein ExbD [Candidatus Moanabacter tarae]|uniref:Biopolymer transport protein ExbD n=1 Tax=Candidatus Moanibacter tarae TaxID=2200854 RepID=A0A2Z4ACY0_9BACT|nr:MAG: Biopolymer transport protein ExbD [Candidatus Moanabacter tarae]|tara:strand:- start:12137 stop:12535 length:399 start_codon:yes stop_codon:yes gene_type:complete